MRLDDEKESGSFEDRTGRRGGGFRMPGGGGALQFVGSKFGIGGILALLVITWLMGGDPIQLLTGGGGAPSSGVASGPSTLPPSVKTMVLKVLGSTERRWGDIFAASGRTYEKPVLVFYSDSDQSGCGAAQAAMGPFYCPADQRIYLDVSFFDELATRFGARGDFASAYVIAHEVGHHVQHLLGTADQVRQAQRGAGEAEANALQVKMELQADCYAGVWAANDANLLEPGDMEEGVMAANAIGDDTLQRAAGRRPVPESFTHGTSAQRVAWLRKGLETGDPAQCDTFGGGI